MHLQVDWKNFTGGSVSEEITTSIFRAKQSKKNGPSLNMEDGTSLTISQHGVGIVRSTAAQS